MSDAATDRDGIIYKPDTGEREPPFSVLWTTLPGISALVPVIGHVGITDSHGVPFDFSGPYQVTVGSLMCGPAKRVWQLDSVDDDAAYDAAVDRAARAYGKKMHNLATSNCHHHVASVLNHLHYAGRTDWTQLRVFWHVWTRGRWVSSSACLSAFTPSIIIVIVASGIAFYLAFRNR